VSDGGSPAGEALLQLARGLVEEITAVKAAELARQLSPAPDGPPPDDAGPPPAWPAHFRAWHPTLADPDCRTHLLGYPDNRAHLLGWQAELAAGPPPEEGHDPSAARPAARRRRRRWQP
jgi:hypothetical protein